MYTKREEEFIVIETKTCSDCANLELQRSALKLEQVRAVVLKGTLSPPESHSSAT